MEDLVEQRKFLILSRLTDCHLQDGGYLGAPFTWSDNRDPPNGQISLLMEDGLTSLEVLLLLILLEHALIMPRLLLTAVLILGIIQNILNF